MPQSRFFQIHLSTAVVLMLVAGVLVWANVRGIKDEEFGYMKYGWPAYCAMHFTGEFHAQKKNSGYGEGFEIPYIVTAFDLFVAFIILYLIWSMSERRIRRRTAHQAEEGLERYFYMLHRSTVIVLLAVFGILAWANAAPRRIRYNDPMINQLPDYWPRYARDDWNLYGWPFKFVWSVFRDTGDKQNVLYNIWSLGHGLLDLLIALAILLSVCVACEWRIRPRAARKAAE